MTAPRTKYSLIASFFFACFLSFSQPVLVEVTGFTHAQADTFSFVEIVITKDVDTLQIVKSNALGYFSWRSEQEPETKITFSSEVSNFRPYKLDLIVQSYPMKMRLDFDFIEILIDRVNEPRFEENVLDTFTGFDLELFQWKLREFDAFCIVFHHVTYLNESDEIAKLRMERFKQYLIDGGVDISNFLFDSKQMVQECPYDDCRAAIQGEIISLEESCQ